MTNLLKSFASVPAPVTSLSVKVNLPAVYVKLELPPLTVHHPLFEYRSAEIVYKKASFLATSTTKTVPLEAYLKNREDTNVTVKISDLAEGSSYQMKVRLMNANGMGAWSRVEEFKVEDDSSEEDSEEEKRARRAKKQEREKEKSRKAKKDTETKASGEKRRKKKKHSQEAEKRRKEETDSQEETEQSSEEEVEQSSRVEVKQNSQIGVEQNSQMGVEQSNTAKTESRQTQEAAPKPKANAPQPLTHETLLHFITSGDVEALDKVDASVLSEFVSPEGLPALHLCLLECRDVRRVQATLQCLLKKGCSLQQEATCVFTRLRFHS